MNIISSSEEALNVLLSGDRKPIGLHFGVGLLVTSTDTVEDVVAKCNNYIERYEGYIANLKLVVENREQLETRIGSVKINKLISKLSDAEKQDLLKALASR